MQKRQNLPIVCGTLVVINVIVYLICTFTGIYVWIWKRIRHF